MTDGRLTVWESSQNVRGYRFGLAQQLKISPSKIRFISTFVGGAFGSKGELGQATALIALAAKRVGRPVKLVASRSDGFTLRTFRAETRHHLQLGADKEGSLTALSHLSWEITSRTDRYAGLRLRLYLPALRMPQCAHPREKHPSGSPNTRLHARSSRNALSVSARVRDGRTFIRARHRSSRPAAP